MSHPRPLSAAVLFAALALAACSQDPPLRTGLVTPVEIHAFYHSHPALFEGRRLYSVREIVVSTPAAFLSGLETRVGQAHSMGEVERWLDSQGIPYQAATATHAAEDVPVALLARMSTMKPGELALVDSSEGATVWELVESRDAPLSEADAAPAIEQFLAGRALDAFGRHSVRS